MLNKIQKLIEALNENGIKYCHWKSNIALAESLSGETDIDLLIHRKDACFFRKLLSQFRFHPVVMNGVERFPSVEHYFAMDNESGALIHVHAYYRVITGESLTKNYRFPIEEMLLQNTRQLEGIPVPSQSAELVVFVLRMMLKHTSLVELILLARYWNAVQQEINWLLERDLIDKSLNLIQRWLPSLDAVLFTDCIAALKMPAPLFRRVILGHRLRSQLRFYTRHLAFRAWGSGIRRFAIMLFRRLMGYKLSMVPQSGGAVIAFVGSEASGKSTLLAEMKNWLGQYFTVEQVHAGKPKATSLSILPNLFVPAMRVILPTYRSTHIESKFTPKEKVKKTPASYPIISAFRSVLLAYDRRSLLTRGFRQAANGVIVLCDRYPSLVSGAPDSPQLAHISTSPNRFSIRTMLTNIESRLYREIPPPDLVIHLSVPLKVALARNAIRDKKEPEDYVRRRHAQCVNFEFGNTPVCKINTDQSFEQTLLEIKKIIWNAF